MLQVQLAFHLTVILELGPLGLTLDHDQHVHPEVEGLDELGVLEHSGHLYEVGLILIVVQFGDYLEKH